MTAVKNINIGFLLSKDSGILPIDGHVLYKELIDSFTSNSDQKIIIDFTNLQFVTSAFINASIGKFLIENPKYLDKIGFEFSNISNLNLRVERSINLAINQKLRAAHEESLETILE